MRAPSRFERVISAGGTIAAIATAARAEFTGMVVEPYLDPAWVEHGYDPASLFTFRLYAAFDDDEGAVLAVGDSVAEPVSLLLGSCDGVFFNSTKPGAGDLPPMDLRARGIWEPQWDTFVSIGESTYAGAEPVTRLVPGFGKQVDGLAGSFTLDDSGWFVLGVPAEANAVNGRVMIAQVTLVSPDDMVIARRFRILGRDVRDDPSTFFDVVVDDPKLQFQCTEDLDGDGLIAFDDLSVLLANWGDGPVGDIDGDGSVGFNDLTRLLAAWGPCCRTALAGSPDGLVRATDRDVSVAEAGDRRA